MLQITSKFELMADSQRFASKIVMIAFHNCLVVHHSISLTVKTTAF